MNAYYTQLLETIQIKIQNIDLDMKLANDMKRLGKRS